MLDRRTEHERVFELLPWLVNGRLDRREYPRVLQHLEQCQCCRAELAAQQRLSAAINQPDKIEFAPQASFNKLWERIVVDEQAGRPSPPSSETLRQGWIRSKQWWTQYWLPIAAALQALVIVVLGVLLSTPRTTGNDDSVVYRTVTTADSVVTGTLFRVVFDDATRLADVKDVLSRSQLTVVAGPSAAGVYSLAPANKGRPLDLQETLNGLREDPRVRFVELAQR